MRICQLVSSYQESASPFRGIDPYPDASRWLPEHDWTCRLIDKATAAAAVDDLAAQGFDVFVNLCDGEPGEDIAGIEVVQRLELRGVAFTGADSRFYARGSSRRALKEACRAAGIDTPAHLFLEGGAPSLAGAAEGLRFPLIVKPPNGYASIGIERTSRVTTPAELHEACARTAARFGGVLLEEFIEGREFTALVAEPPLSEDEGGPRSYPPMEVVFPPGESFKHFDLKWQDYEDMQSVPVADPALSAALQDRVRRIFTAMGGVGYARCDIRMDRAGRLFLLDCNAMPGVFYAPSEFGMADFILAQQPDGHRRFLRDLIDRALSRHRAAAALRRGPDQPAR
jgi:D-alanine-D-alanine ligase